MANVVVCPSEILITFFFSPAQASAGNQGILGPTKIYLAVQPADNEDENSQVRLLCNVNFQWRKREYNFVIAIF